jgi:hypothetical protein
MFVRAYVCKFSDSSLALWIEGNFTAHRWDRGLDSQLSFVFLLSCVDRGLELGRSTAQEVQRTSYVICNLRNSCRDEIQPRVAKSFFAEESLVINHWAYASVSIAASIFTNKNLFICLRTAFLLCCFSRTFQVLGAQVQ